MLIYTEINYVISPVFLLKVGEMTQLLCVKKVAHRHAELICAWYKMALVIAVISGLGRFLVII